MTRSRSSSSRVPAWLQAGCGRPMRVAMMMALVLLIAQTQATLHWLSHSTAAVQNAAQRAQGRAAEATSRLASTPDERVAGVDTSVAEDGGVPRSDPGFDLSCDKCSSIASLAAMLHGGAFELALEEGRDVQVAALAWSSAERLLRLGYLSRAPPTAG